MPLCSNSLDSFDFVMCHQARPTMSYILLLQYVVSYMQQTEFYFCLLHPPLSPSPQAKKLSKDLEDQEEDDGGDVSDEDEAAEIDPEVTSCTSHTHTSANVLLMCVHVGNQAGEEIISQRWRRRE